MRLRPGDWLLFAARKSSEEEDHPATFTPSPCQQKKAGTSNFHLGPLLHSCRRPLPGARHMARFRRKCPKAYMP